MKKLMLTVCLILGLLIVALPMAMAESLQIGYATSGYGPYQTGVGGEFTVNPLGGWVNLGLYSVDTKDVGVTGTFQTFCIEGLEYIYPYPATYNVVLNTKAMYGSNPPNGDPLSVGAAWLYHEFQISGTFDGKATYNYGSGRGTSADLLQKALWWLEGEEGIGYDANNPFMKAVVEKFGSEGDAKADNAGQYPVMVMNLYDSNGGNAQDLLVCVPEPGILILLGLAMSAIGIAVPFVRKI